MKEVPALHEAMQKHFGSLGQLRQRRRLRPTIRPPSRPSPCNSPGTEAAAAAHAWLGDREFSMGHVARGQPLSRGPARLDSGPSRGGVAGYRLAEAMMGRDVGQPVTAPVNVGEVRMDAAEFERLVRELRETRAKTQGPAGRTRTAPPRCRFVLLRVNTSGDIRRGLPAARSATGGPRTVRSPLCRGLQRQSNDRERSGPADGHRPRERRIRWQERSRLLLAQPERKKRKRKRSRPTPPRERRAKEGAETDRRRSTRDGRWRR